MTNEEMFPKIQAALSRALNVDPSKITPETSPDNLEEWDSMGHLMVIMELETEFGISFKTDDILVITSVDLAMDFIREYLAA